MEYHDFDDSMFNGAGKIDFHSFKNGQHKFRILPPYAPGKLFLQIDLHWGFTDENGKKKTLKCTKYSHKSCPVCDEVDRLKGQVELLKATPSATADQKKATDEQIVEVEKRINDIRKKPTYLWNILTENNEQKVLNLSWNGHEPLENKVKFFWQQKKINVTSPTANYLMYCERTGLNAKTRYAYEVIETNIKPLDGLKPLTDLSKVYLDTTPDELALVVKNGFVPTKGKASASTGGLADLPSGLAAETTTAAPATETKTETAAPVDQSTQLNVPAGVTQPGLNSSAALTAEQETENLMKMLQNP